MYNNLVLLFIIAIIFTASGFQLPNRFSNPNFRPIKCDTSMMFGGGKKKAAGGKIVVKVDGKTIESSEKTVNLRKLLTGNKVEVYPLKAKILGNCGGAGICGTCAVQVLDGANNLNPPSKNEQNTLAKEKKPAGSRLSCCSRVSGPITIKTKV